MTLRSMRDVYLTLDILDTPFRRQRIKDLGWELYAIGGDPVARVGRQLHWVSRRRRLTVLEGRELHDEKVWHHVSMSHADRLPTWDEFSEAKRDFIGHAVEAYLVHPPANRYVNIHPRVLHWYSCIDRPDGVLPDFRVSDAGDTRGNDRGIGL